MTIERATTTEELEARALANRRSKALLVGKYGRLDHTKLMLDTMRTSASREAQLCYLADLLGKLGSRRMSIEHKRNQFEPGNLYWNKLQAVIDRADTKMVELEDRLFEILQERRAKRGLGL